MKTISKLMITVGVAASLAIGPGSALAVSSDDGLMADNAQYQDAKGKTNAGRHAEAAAVLAALLKDHPRDADALNLMGFNLRKSGRIQEALGYYRRALEEKPLHLGANEYLGELYVEIKQLDKAKERLAVLARACNSQCEEYHDLAKAIAGAATR